MKANILVILIFLLACYDLSAKQGNGNVKGVANDETGNPLPFATVVLKNANDSTLVKAELSNELGEFNFLFISFGAYFLEIKYTGYETYRSQKFALNENNSSQNCGIIKMNQAQNSLQAVTVTADKPFIERQSDKMVVNIENSIINSGSSLLDLMEKLPAVQVNQDGRVSLKGKPTVIIMMDGKPMGIAGQDLSNLLRGIPSSNIQKIEIITNPSAKYDAAGNAGIINIITKRNKKEGLSGSVNASYLQGRYEKYNSGFNLGFKNKKINFFSSYNYSHRKGFNNLMLTRNFYRNDSLNTSFVTDNYIVFPFNTHTPRMGADIFLSEKTSVSITGAAVANDFSPYASNNTIIYDGNKSKISSYEFRNNSSDHWRNYSLNSQIKHQLDSSGTQITADLDYARYWNFTNQVFTNSIFDADGVYTGDKILLGDQKGNLSIYSAKTDFTKNLGSKMKLEAGAKSSYVEMASNVDFYNVVNGVSSFDSSQSNHFIYSENINAGYLNSSLDLKKLSFQFGLRGEQTIANGNQLITGEKFSRNYFQLFPSAFADYKPNKRHGFNLSLSRRIDRPAYQQMNPFKKLIDATTYSTGNPALLPQLTYNSEFTWSYRNCFFTTLGYSFTHNNITDVLVQDNAKRITVQTVLNLTEYQSYSANLVFAKKLCRWWTTNTSVFSFYGIFRGVVNNYHLNQAYPSFIFNTSNSFAFGKGLSAELSFIYNHKSLYGVTLVNPNYNLTIGIQKQIMKGKGSFILSCSDILWRAWPSGYTDFGNVNESWRAVRDTRQLNCTFNYRFGKGQVRVKKNSGADTEKSRAGG